MKLLRSFNKARFLHQTKAYHNADNWASHFERSTQVTPRERFQSKKERQKYNMQREVEWYLRFDFEVEFQGYFTKN